MSNTARALWSASRLRAAAGGSWDADPGTMRDLQAVVGEIARRGSGAGLMLLSPMGEPRLVVSAGGTGKPWISLALRVTEHGQPQWQSGAVGAPIQLGDATVGALLLYCPPGQSGLRGHYLAGVRAAAAHVETILARQASQRETLFAAAEALLQMLNAHDPATARHSRTVRQIARSLGETLGLPAPDLLHLELAALLHDVGKVAVPPEILRADRPLDQEEWGIMRGHPAVGERVIRSVPDLRPCLGAVRHHHERWDGLGYPDRLVGPAIPLPARLISLADAYEALRCGRPYQRPRSAEDALAEIRASLGTQFDPGHAHLLPILADPGGPAA